jgi:DNA-binding transcriptional LysR family regulator
LATVLAASYHFSVDVVARFVTTQSYVNLSLQGRSSPSVVDFVDSGKADLGFLYDVAINMGNVTTWPLFGDEMSLVLPINKR